MIRKDDLNNNIVILRYYKKWRKIFQCNLNNMTIKSKIKVKINNWISNQKLKVKSDNKLEIVNILPTNIGIIYN